jgi:hypothetical protein
MPAHRTRPQRPKAPEHKLLIALASNIDDAFSHLAAHDPAHVLRLINRADNAEGFELGLLPLATDVHPAEAMAGFTAPADWSAVGVVITGRSEELVAPGRPDRGERAPQPVRLTFLLARSDRSVALLTQIGAMSSERRVLCEPPLGVLADACRLVLGLHTAEPTEGPELWLSVRWLDRLLAAALDQPGAVRTWGAAVRLHPLISGGPQPMPQAVAALTEQAAVDFDWERLRLLATRGQGAEPAITPAVASWMDAGFFARHLLAAELPIDLLVTELDALVPGGVMAAVRRALPASCRGT